MITETLLGEILFELKEITETQNKILEKLEKLEVDVRSLDQKVDEL